MSGRKRNRDVDIEWEEDVHASHNGTTKEESPFVKGSIVRMKLTKFLTYDSLEFMTGPYLNVIIGPNGTGKSAIVCAICLGLGGKTSWLGRASDPRDYIKYGADKAKIEIELYNPDEERNFIIKREISHNRASHWWINKKAVTQKAVEELVSSLNIQVGNLCQFLPQEKVAEFARMSQQELLENTEKSVGAGNLYEHHKRLKEARSEARGMEQDVDKMKEQLDVLKQKNARLEQDVQCYKDRKEFLDKVDILKMKKPWLEAQLLKEQFNRAKEEKDKKAQELKEESKKLRPLQRQLAGLKEDKDSIESDTKDASKMILSKAKEIETSSHHMINKSEEITIAKNDFNAKMKEEEARKKRLVSLQEQLHAKEAQLADLSSRDDRVILSDLEKLAGQLREVNMEMTNVQTEGETLLREINEIKADIKENEKHLRQISDVNNRRLETLRKMHQHTYDAVMWLRANKDMFKHTIHEPMIVCLNVTNPADAGLVETHISFNDLRSFVCEDSNDLELFMKKVKTEQGLRVNAIKAPPQAASSFRTAHPISHYRKYGFNRYLQDLFTCPEPVMRYLCLMYRVHNIPVGGSEVKRNTTLVTQECPELTFFYAADVQFSIKKSKYDNSISSRNSALKSPKALAVSADLEREKQLKKMNLDQTEAQRTKEDEYRIVQRKSEDLEKQINTLREKKRNLMKAKDQRKAIETEIRTKRQKIELIQREAMDVQGEEQRLQRLLQKSVQDKLKHLDKMKTKTAECLRLAEGRVRSSLKLAECCRSFVAVETQLRNAKQKYDSLEREMEELKGHVADTKQQYRDKYVEAKRVAGIGVNDDMEEQLTARGVWEAFLAAPSRLRELDSEIHSMQARAEAMFQVDEQIIKEFETREKEIEKLDRLFHARESQRLNHQESIEESKRLWFKPLQELIERINLNFSYFFSCLDCCGEVGLSTPENPEDYERYGLSIKVKFRDNESLRELTAFHQSGGERSVSTVLFMMALQELTKCPFRSVDEINQGMDPVNERKIFQLVVETVCKRSGSQYFLLTPKLLPDLMYVEHMTVLCVFNGSEMMSHDNWNVDRFIARRAQLATD